MRFTHSRKLIVVAALTLAGCAPEGSPDLLDSSGPSFSRAGTAAATSHAIDRGGYTDLPRFVRGQMATMNARLTAEGSPMRVEVAEMLLAADAPSHSGTTVFANDREQRLPYFWVPGDERREADGNNLTYLILDPLAWAYTRESFPNLTYLGSPLDASFRPWMSLPCHKANTLKRQWVGGNPSILLGGDDPFQADIIVGGWLNLPVGILGVAYTFVFVDENDVPTDIDRDRREDTAHVEIWYNLGYYWSINDPANGIDLPHVATHENGHAYGIGHFGMLHATGNGKLHFSPAAVMNAAYVIPIPQLQGTDRSSFCQSFASWPRR